MHIIDTIHPEGLGGGTILSGSMSASFGNAFWYYPIIASTAEVKFGNMVNSFGKQIGFTAGVGVKGAITQVTQSAGLAIVYHAQADTNYSFEVSGSGQASPDYPNAYTQLYSTASTDSSYGLQRDRTNGLGYR
jgi:hypothetical protein